MTNQAPPPPPPPPGPRGPAAEPPAGDPGPRRQVSPDKVQRTRIIGGIVISIVAIWFIMANLHRVDITFWFVTVSSPMWLTLAGTFIAGMAATLLFTRHRRNSPPPHSQT